MTAKCPSVGLIATTAIDQLEAAVDTILQLESLFRSIRKQASTDRDMAKLGALGEYFAMDHANSFDVMRESLRDQLADVLKHPGESSL